MMDPAAPPPFLDMGLHYGADGRRLLVAPIPRHATDEAGFGSAQVCVSHPRSGQLHGILSPEDVVTLRDFLTTHLEAVSAYRTAKLGQALATTANASLRDMSDDEADALLPELVASVVREKLAAARAKGRDGWHTPACAPGVLADMLSEHLAKGDPRDVIILAAMLLARGEKTKAPA